MQPANLINSLQTLARSAKPLIVADNKTAPISKTVATQASLPQPGQRIQGIVQAQVSPGLFKVQVAGQLVQMALPSQLKAGAVVELKVISNSPKLTLSFLASTTPAATQERLSPASRLLSNLTELPLARTFIQSSSGRPVWQATDTAPNSHQLAGALRDALANSGLFYESHQAQWVRGQRSTAQLLVEPQNKLKQEAQAKQATDPTPAQQGKTAADSSLTISKDLLPLVQQQLHTLETHQLTWSGPVWPGQQMQWEIQGQPEQNPTQQDERQWSTEMELALPKLGDVHAKLVFKQSGIKLVLNSSDAHAIALFNRRLPALARTLAEAGIPLTGAVIEKHEPPLS